MSSVLGSLTLEHERFFLNYQIFNGKSPSLCVKEKVRKEAVLLARDPLDSGLLCGGGFMTPQGL